MSNYSNLQWATARHCQGTRPRTFCSGLSSLEMPYPIYGMYTYKTLALITLLIKVRTLSDTTKSGQLLFPEFALAMYLCNLKLTGKDLPNSLPERIRNEVSSMVDIISFGIPDEQPSRPTPRGNAPNFDEPAMQNTQPPPTIQQPQPQQSSIQLLSTLVSQPTGFGSQMTGYPPQSGPMPQPTGIQAQPTGFAMPQAMG